MRLDKLIIKAHEQCGLERQQYMKQWNCGLKLLRGTVILIFVNRYSRKTSRNKDWAADAMKVKYLELPLRNELMDSIKSFSENHKKLMITKPMKD